MRVLDFVQSAFEIKTADGNRSGLECLMVLPWGDDQVTLCADIRQFDGLAGQGDLGLDRGPGVGRHD